MHMIHEIFEKHGFKRISVGTWGGYGEVYIYDDFIKFDSLLKVAEELKKHNIHINGIRIDIDIHHTEDGPRIITHFTIEFQRR